MGETTEKKTVRSDEMKKNIDLRLKKIEGQVRGIQKMIQADSYCDDILIQMSAASAALDAVSSILLEHHIHHCIFDRMQKGDETVVDEFIITVKRAMKK